ncbi:MAG: HlyD family efflux transporter periplasmic adaptor subunit [Rhodospirillaceae bacterium]|nr:HlyD family efflux transporter periplasmic adaptor subunit [Rhodospirillaceae bacterium]
MFKNIVGSWSRRARVIVGTGLVVAVFLVWALRPQPVPVDLTAVSRGELLVTIGDEGETRVKDVYIVSAPVAGRVERIEMEVGDTVVADETVLALFQPQDPSVLDARSRSEAEAGVSLAEAERARAQAQLEFAQSDLKRQEQLLREGTISQAAFDRAKLAVKTAEAAVAQAVASVTKRRADLETSRAAMAKAGRPTSPGVKFDYIPVRAPVSGRLLKRMQQSETILAAGTPLLEIGDPSTLEIVTDLISTDAVKVKPGQEVIIEDWGGPAPLKGVVRRVEPFGFTKVSALGIEEQRVNVIIDFTSPPEEWASLGHGYRVETRIVTVRRENAFKVPVSALFRTGEDWSVFRVPEGIGGGTVKLSKIKLGSRNTLEAEIIEGLSEGDVVIMHPSDQVRDGVRVAPRE